jgi:hypothetical protein
MLCGLVAVPAALAAARAAGDGVLELRSVDGAVVVTGSSGTLWGQMDRGRLVVTDPLPGDGNVLVSGFEKTRSVSDSVTVYIGKDLHFRVTGGRYKLALKGAGIDLTAVGVGTAQLTGDVLADDAGSYAVDQGKWAPVPLLGQRTVPFGVQPAPAGGLALIP